MVKTVKIIIKEGKIDADFQGFQGQACDHLAQRIHPDNLQVEDKTLNPEYHQENNQSNWETN